MRVPIIEGSQGIVTNTCDYLEGLDSTIDAAGDGVTGLHLAFPKDYDVVILDLDLPGIDGVDLYPRLRQVSTTVGTSDYANY